MTIKTITNGCQEALHHCHVPCCQKKRSLFDTLIIGLEKVSLVALGVFSAYIDLKLFVPSFFAGMCISVYIYFQDKKEAQCDSSVSSCAHGFVEQLTGVKLPAAISLAANLGVTVCHIEHHATVFVPIIGVSLGAWVGKLAFEQVDFWLNRTPSNLTSIPAAMA